VLGKQMKERRSGFPLAALNGCVEAWRPLHLQQIYSKISPQG